MKALALMWLTLALITLVVVVAPIISQERYDQISTIATQQLNSF